ncbi:MAG: metallophosphoesterase [Opitutales bacterium]|nr:metallophosphoesterase [Opitutales bacterium]
MDRRTFINACTGLCLFNISGFSNVKQQFVSFAQISDMQFGMANIDAQGKLSRGIRKTIHPLKTIPEKHPLKEFQLHKYNKEIENCNICIDTINKMKPNFLFVTGDMVQHMGNKKELEIFKNVIGRVHKSIKIYYVPGNHDLSGNSPQSISNFIKEYGYDRFCFTKNNVAFIGINTEIIKSKNQNLRNSHFEWIEKSLDKVKDVSKIIVFGHTPIFMIDINEGNSYSNFPINERKRYVEIFNKYKVSAYHCGHTHKFNIIKSQYCCKQIVVGAVGIPLGVDASSGYYIDDKWIKISEPNPDCSKLYI